jgi:type II secretory pathway pseudopilin PulG
MKNIKISKKALLVIGIIVFAIVLGILINTYAQQVKEREELETSLVAQQALATKLTADREDWEDKLAQAQSLINTSRAKFPKSVDSIEYDDDLFEIADDCNLELTTVSMSKPTSNKIGSVTYSVSSCSLQVKGNVDDILNFLYALRTGDDFNLPWSAAVNSVKIDFGVQALANISLSIYAY